MKLNGSMVKKYSQKNKMKKFEFKQTLFIKKIDVDEKLINEIENIKMRRYGKSINNYMRLDESTIQKSQFFFNYLKKFIDEICIELGKTKFFVRTFWFQDYSGESDKIDTHVHHCGSVDEYSFIFYIKCTEKSAHTIFHAPGYPYTTDEAISIKPEKGLCVFFPGYLPHESDANYDKTRFVMSGNIRFE